MAFLDISDILLDADFCDTGIVCMRNTEVVDIHGHAVITSSSTTFTGVVTNNNGDILQRKAAGEHTSGNINVRTSFPLQDGTEGRTADTIMWQGRTYTVGNVKDFSNFGKGFVVAICDLLPLSK